ncbi:MAG: 4Fe-4S binding protein [Archaeoglobaceae archaeon]
MEVDRSVDVHDDRKFRFIQKAADEVRELVFDPVKCNGCGICVYSCPVRAIELSEIHEIAKGLDMPPVIIDHLQCAYCGICYAFCPFDAYEFYINGEKVEKDELTISPVATTQKLDNCEECTLCYKVCPTEAIERKIHLHRDDIPQKNEEGMEGKLEVDKEKCNLCGICAEFCRAFQMVDKEVKPDSIMPYDDILTDEDKCDYCKLCEEICPEDAIKVEGKRIEYELPEKIAEIIVDQKLCSYCTYCVHVCPYDAVKTIKPTEGTLKLYEKRMDKCEPLACMACVNICKNNHVWWVEDKLRFNEDYCIHCGACENACPYDLIEVHRKAFYSKERLNEPWREAWNKALERVINKEVVSIEEIQVPIEEPPEAEKIASRPKMERVQVKKFEDMIKISTYKRLQNILKTPAYRRAFEKGNAKLMLKAVRKHASERLTKKE